MKSLKQVKLFPWLMLGASILGIGLGLWLFSGGPDKKGLFVAAHPAITALFILTALTLLVLFLGVRKLEETMPYGKLFRPSVSAMAGCFVAAAGILVTDVYEMFFRTGDMITFLSCLAGIPAAGCLVFLGFCRKQGKRPHPLFHCCVTVYLMLHLISQYRGWSSEPQLIVYSFPMLASVFLMLSLYYRTTLDAGTKKRKSFLFFNYGALFFCCIALCESNPIFYATMALYAATAGCSLEQQAPLPTMYLPKEVLYCINALQRAGHQAYAVGGCVRDALLEQVPQDYDICTSASPEQTVEVFSHHELVRNGEKHGTVGVILDREVYEITTFRTEGGYSDSRHPDWVEFVAKIDDDLARRDFTINAMAYSPDQGFIDPWGGQKDLNDKLLRAVGDPIVRFSEDPLRILRGVRFTVRFGLTPEKNTLNAMISQAPLMDKLARERVFAELCKILPYMTTEDMIRFAPIITQVIPELQSAVGFQQHSPHHAYDVYTHTAHVVEAVPPEISLRLAALLHDISKPAVFTQDETGRGHFYGHAREGGKTADAILVRLKAPNLLRSQVIFLVENHMTPFEPDKKLLRKHIAKHGIDAVWQLLTLQRADHLAKGTDEDNSAYFNEIEQLLTEIRLEGSNLTAKDLAINGQDLLNLGLQPGPHIGEAMNFLLDLVHDELVPNTADALLTAAKGFFNMEDAK